MSDEIEALSVPEVAFTSLIILALGSGSLVSTADFAKEQSVNLTAQKVYNNALALQSYPEGYTEIGAEDYSVRYTGGELSVKFKGRTATKSFSGLGYDSIEGPEEYTEVEEKICMRKNRDGSQEVLVLEVGGC